MANKMIDIFFLTETDTKAINCETDYVIQGYQTIFHERKNPNDVQRLICLVKEDLMNNIRSMRSITNEMLPVQSFTELSKNTFINDGIKAWNLAPAKIKDCLTYASAKKEIK